MASEGSVLYVRFLEQTCKGNNSVSVNDSSYSATWSGCESVLDLPSDFITSGHVASVRMTIGHGGEPYSLRMAIQAMPQPGKPELELRYLSPKQGYIQTPGLPPGTGREYPPLEESWVQVAVPSDHVVLVSFVYMFLRVDGYGRCRVETLELLTGERSEGNVVWSGCASLTPFPTVYEADVLHVHFSGDLTLDRSKGFRLLFSFHERDAAPERLDSGLWNCSVPHWPDFELHFLCNLETECAAGEDEATCPYTNSACGQGRISAGRGYKYAYQWEDNTIAYFAQPDLRINKEPPSCGYLSAEDIKLYYCDYPDNAYYLCEMNPVSGIDGGYVSGDDVHGVPSSSACPAPLTSLPPSFTCASGGGRVPYSLVCDHRQDCQDGSDEELCVFPTCTGSTPLQCGDQQEQCVDGADEVLCDKLTLYTTITSQPPPAAILFDGRGSYNYSQLPAETHFQCPGDGYCLPVFVRCNGVYDCPGKEDEAACDSYTCPGLSNCGLTDLDNVEFPNLRSLNLSDNFIQVVGISHLERMPNLQELILSGNPITSLFEKDWGVDMFFPRLQRLDLSRVESPDFDANSFPFPNLQVLNLEGSRIERVAPGGFRTFSKLRALDLRGCPMTQFPQDALQGLDRLNTVFADNYKLCCPATLPKGFNLNNCQAPSNEISSCDALLRSDLYRVFLSVFAGLSLAGNLGSFVVRVFVQKSALRSGFGVFVTSLCVSDFLMGVYLAIIGVADRVYMGTYLWEDTSWRNSAACKTAGFFSLVSNEVSAFIICLITLDRFLVLRFPFSNLCFKKGSALIASAVVWLFGLVVATVPLVMGSQWEFYSQNGICLPLPITRNDFPGHDYAFGVMIVLNFVLFLLIAAGQASIYASIRANSMSASSTSKKSQDLSIARRLITIAVSDFLCWFPIGLLGLLASQGTPVPGEVNVSMAIFVLPLNSALNPFLYTLNTILERRQRAQEETLLKSITSQGSLKSTKITTEG
nr:hypothetical protein BaRGS_028815 [Batillaria attramentaria]